MSDTYQTIQTKVFAAVEADENGDAARALQLMEQAQMLLAITPDGKNEDAEVAFDRESIDRAVSRLKQKINRQTGVVMESVRYERG